MKFKYYIVDTSSADVFGTNDEAKAREATKSDHMFVVDAEEARWIPTPLRADDMDVKEL